MTIGGAVRIGGSILKNRVAFQAVTVAAAALFGLAAVPTQAHAAWSCQAGTVCLYENFGLTGTTAVLPELNTGNRGELNDFRRGRYTNPAVQLNDTVSSVYNRTDKPVYLYEHGDFNYHQCRAEKNSDFIKISPGQALDLSSWTYMNDKASSASIGKEMVCDRSRDINWDAYWVNR
ncbi:peptidase inhibitor family I36 protein [Streptomyces sp. NBC_01637]|uniref:peptidase inhibitor family I36 protein n=1 Tax=unclassified Streptomyces TaxID=2593676 RepID=UPI0038684155|nr:peptidase inhibitor family I36 protein [Streptomyces sp. NBC_01653]WTC84598.1 peptidase inhibitor family I36 protein [Streptomyces sp. NBC_01653]WTD86269.1 peptidase inhibitor family I36 protein [Streptomyces sp. NBC_01637]WTD94255.1 peptidase inhibitor family I36 protein [Streptomyces sp. NBC_01637]